MKWLLFFTHWVFIFWGAWLTGLTKASPVLLLWPGAIASILYTLTIRPPVNLAILLILSHVVPLWLSRKASADIEPFLLVSLAYLIFLWSQNTTVMEVYEPFVRDPPKTLSEFLERTGFTNFDPKLVTKRFS